MVQGRQEQLFPKERFMHVNGSVRNESRREWLTAQGGRFAIICPETPRKVKEEARIARLNMVLAIL